ncbi:MAG: protein kinase [Anaerolineae bacterium]|nr:protein kinase [Anaerolineae bacterium]
MKQLIGTQIGQYQIEALLGEGGMGAVYRAHDLKHDRMVAFKIMLANLAQKPQFRSRFMQEADAIAHFSSPAIVAVYGTGTYEESPYIVMEYIEGGSLVNYMRQLEWSGAKPTVETTINIAAQIAEGLSYAHQRGLIHRDIKPGNILLKMRDGAYVPRQAVITDFGLAIQRKDGDEMDTAPFMGSLAYMSPEQCENRSIDGRSDIYALGILLYQLTTGQLPFKINAPADIVKHLEETPLPPSLINPDLPEILENIILKAMEKKPGDRYQSAAELAHALRQALANPNLQTAVLAKESSVVTQWLDNKWVAAINVEDRVDIHQTWTSLGKNRLFIVHQYEESRIEGLDKDEITIGREASNDIVLNDQSVSGKHIRLTRSPQGWRVSDLGSTNHTFLGERLLEYEQAYDWPSEESLRVGPFFLRWQPFEAEHREHDHAPLLASAALMGAAATSDALLTAAPAATTAAAAPAVVGSAEIVPEYSDGEILGIAIMPPTLELDPGAQNLLEISITNRDVTVKDILLRLEANGHPPSWVTLSDYQMKLLPDETINTTALVDLSQAPDILAGLHVVRLVATTDKGEVEVNEAHISVRSQEDFGLDLHPSNLQEKITCRLTISDRSNFQNEYTIMGIDDSDALVFDFDEPQNAVLSSFDDQEQQMRRIKVSPRQEAWLGFRIRPRKRPLFGSTQTYPFKIRIQTKTSDWQSLTGQVDIDPRITRRILLLFLLLMLLICGTGYLAFYRYNTVQAERYAVLQGQLTAAEERANAAREQLSGIEAQIEAAKAAGASDEEIAALEAAKAAAEAELNAASADAAALGDEAASAAENANIDAEATAAAEAAAATAIAAAFTPTPEPNNPPTGIAFDANSVKENSNIGTVVGEFTATDPDVAVAGGIPVAMNRSRLSRITRQSDDFTYSLVSGSGSTNNDYFTIKGNELVTAVDIDYETTSSLSFRVEVADAAGDTFAQSFTLTVIDTDDIPKLSISDVTVSEADGSAKITVAVSGDNFDTASVDYATAGGTAVAGTDYTTTTGTLTWEKGDTDDQTITIPLLNNQIDQPDRTFVVSLTNAENATIQTGSATVTITDDDAEPTITISDLTISESVTGGKASITVELTGASSEAVTVDYATSDGTATAGTSADYIKSSGTLTWAPEATGTTTFNVTINTDDIDEPDETFIVTLSNSTNAAISDSTATITISDDNEAPKIIIGDVTLTEGDLQITVPVTMTGKSSQEAWVDYSTSNGNGNNAATSDLPDPDFDSTIGRLTWAAATSGVKTITIQINDDDIYESNPEFFVVSLFDNSSNVILQDNLGNIYIKENDSPPQIAISSAATVTANETETAQQVTVALTGRSSNPITLEYRTNEGTATAGLDYVNIPTGSVTWPALDSTPKTIRVTIVNDDIDENAVGSPTPEATETFTLDLESATNATIDTSRDQVTFTIVDNDRAAITITGPADADGTINEATPPESTTYSVVLGSQPVGGDVSMTVVLTDTDGISTVNQCTSTTTSLTFTEVNWKTAKTVTVVGTDDLYEDGNQSCRLVVTPDSTDALYNALAPVSSDALTVVDDDVPRVVVTTNITTTYENPISGTNTITYLVRLATIPTVPVTIALNPGTELSTAPTSLTFPATIAATTNQTVTVTAVNDQIDELTDPHIGTIAHTASGGSYTGLTIDPVTVSITDDDTAGVQVSGPSQATINEAAPGNTATFTVALDTVPVSAVGMSFTATSAASPTQCSVSPTTATFTNRTAQTFTITAFNDAIVDGSQTCTIVTAVTSGDGKYTAINPADVTVTVLNDDVAGYTVTPTTVSVTDSTGLNTSTFQVALTSEPVAPVQINYTGSNANCSATSVTLNNSNWQAGGSVTVTTPVDNIDNGNRSCTLTASVTTTDTNYSGITPASVAVTVVDDDVASFQIAPTSLTVTDTTGLNTATFTMRLSSQPTANVNVTYADSNSICTVSAIAALTSSNWQSGVTVTVTGPIDNIVNAARVCNLSPSVTTTDASYSTLTPASVTVTVQNDEIAAITVNPTALSITDSTGQNSAQFNIRLGSLPTGDVVIPLSVTGGCTVSTPLATIPVASWQTGVNVTVTTPVNNIDEGSNSTCQVVTGTSISTDTNYNGAAVADINVIVNNDDSAGFSRTPATLTLVDSTGSNTGDFTVRLNSQPASDVNLTFTSTGECTVSTPAALTSTNYTTGVSVTVTGTADNVVDGNATCVVSASSITGDPVYVALGNSAVGTVNVTVNNDDVASIVRTVPVPATISETVTAANHTAVFTITLGSQPSSTVRIPLAASSTNNVCSVNGNGPGGNSVDLTATTWQTGVAVTITADNDNANNPDQTCTIAIGPVANNSPSIEYRGLSGASVQVQVLDDD